MSENLLVAKIISDAEAKVAELKAAGEAKAKEVQQETEEKVSVLQEERQTALKKLQAQKELVAVSRAKQDGHIAVQTAKRREIDAVFAEFQSDLVEQSADDYVSFFTKYAKEVLEGEIRVKSVEAPEKRIEETGRILTGLNLAAEVTVNNNISAGFILHAEDGVYDVTLDRMLSNRRSELEMQVVQQIMD